MFIKVDETREGRGVTWTQTSVYAVDYGRRWLGRFLRSYRRLGCRVTVAVKHRAWDIWLPGNRGYFVEIR